MTQPGTVCLLPGGYVDEHGAVHREAELAPLSGREEELLAGMAAVPAAALATQVLARCVRAVGGVRPVTPAVAGRLLVGDRQYLLLKLRELSFGDRVAGTLSCPWPQCGARVSIDFSTADVPVKRCESVAAAYRVELSPEAQVDDGAGGVHRALTFRLPNGDDQEALAPLLAQNPAAALTALLERCVTGADGAGDGPAALVERMGPRAREEVERAMEANAPAVELEMDLSCPECGRAFTAPWDLQDFFFGELRTSRDLLYRQIHYLAYHYHWSEREIMELPRDKRLAYIEVLAEEMEALSDA
jgi:hypothetical protein